MTRDDRRVDSIRSLLVNGGVLTGLLVVGTASVTAQMQQPEPPSVEVPMETMLLVGAIAAIGAFVGVLVANALWSRQASTEPQPQQAPRGQRQQPPQQRGPAGGQPGQQPPQQHQSAGGQPGQQPPQQHQSAGGQHGQSPQGRREPDQPPQGLHDPDQPGDRQA